MRRDRRLRRRRLVVHVKGRRLRRLRGAGDESVHQRKGKKIYVWCTRVRVVSMARDDDRVVQGQNTMVVVNTEWTVTRLKRELRFLELVPPWHWCKAALDPDAVPPSGCLSTDSGRVHRSTPC